MNNCTMGGRLGKDPEIKQVVVKGKESTVCNFSMAVKRPMSKFVDWVNVAVWGKKAEFISTYARKGDFVLCSGSMQSNKYKEKTYWSLAATEVELAKTKGEEDKPDADSPMGKHEPVESSYNDDVPF